ncbi:hypothetical protein F3Y22_tig00112443pilonHSYRG00133 [Hibiscus syriacus]|uniref:Uncharacterized protein n=1 Tax=Hibiscus syriacus TaxID=106335 RepID=A0A6A2WYK0_HIBSY|nr:hypothetical protein F3Y22_tig00112443pilonHSYRG00133 [Hibiscus syriacus]
MRRANNHSWNHLGVRGRDGVLEALPFRAWIHHSDCRPEKRDFEDNQRLDGKWKQAPPMMASCFTPAAVATPRKIYVFRSTPLKAAPFAEVFNVELNRWDKLPNPLVASDLYFQSASNVVLFQSSRSRILVYFGSDCFLQAFNLISESWECLDPSLRYWSDVSKWLDVKWLCKSPVPAPTSISGIKLFHLGNDLKCFAWYSESPVLLNYIKFCVRFDSGKIYAKVEKNKENEKNEETERIINVPFESFNSGKIYATVEKHEETEDSECIIQIPFESFNSDFMLV